MNEIRVFDSDQFGQIRTVNRDGEPWFVAADVCRALKISNPTDAIKRLDDDERARFNLGLPYGETNIVNEPGLYSLVLGSRKPEAKAFKRWITHEVIPAIRRTGRYEAQQTMLHRPLTPDDYLRAATIIATCKTERLPYAVQLLEQAGISVAMLPAKNPTTEERDATIGPLINRAYNDYGIALRALGRATGIQAAVLGQYRRGDSSPKPERAAIIRDAIRRLAPGIDAEDAALSEACAAP